VKDAAPDCEYSCFMCCQEYNVIQYETINFVAVETPIVQLTVYVERSVKALYAVLSRRLWQRETDSSERWRVVWQQTAAAAAAWHTRPRPWTP